MSLPVTACEQFSLRYGKGRLRRGLCWPGLFCLLGAVVVCSCSSESRNVGPDLPQTAPAGPRDPRGGKYEGNFFQLSQGARYFAWYGCGRCHGPNAEGALDLADNRSRHGRELDQVFFFIARGHPDRAMRYGDRVPAEQLWQITAYVRSLPSLAPEKRRRQDADQAGEAQGANWPGPVL